MKTHRCFANGDGFVVPTFARPAFVLPAFVRSDRLAARQQGRLASMEGRVRHPIILTLVMFPVLGLNDVLLAHHDENQARHTFGDTRPRYEAHVPSWFPGHERRGITTGSV